MMNFSEFTVRFRQFHSIAYKLFWVCLGVPLLYCLFMGLYYYLKVDLEQLQGIEYYHQGKLIKDADPWFHFYRFFFGGYSMVVLPMSIGLLAVTLNQLTEQQIGEGLKPALYYRRRYIWLFVFLAAGMLFTYLCLLLTINRLEYFRPELAFWAFPAKKGVVFILMLKIFVASAALAALTYWVSRRVKEYSLLFGFLLMGILISIMFTVKLPFALAFKAYAEVGIIRVGQLFEGQHLTAAHVSILDSSSLISLTLAVLFTLAGFLDVKRKP